MIQGSGIVLGTNPLLPLIQTTPFETYSPIRPCWFYLTVQEYTRCSFYLILELLGIFMFFCLWQAEFSQICRNQISNKILATNFNGKYISSPTNPEL